MTLQFLSDNCMNPAICYEMGNHRKEGTGEKAIVLHDFPSETVESTFPRAKCGLAGRGMNGVPRPHVTVKY